jgi:hypothetical protein
MKTCTFKTDAPTTPALLTPLYSAKLHETAVLRFLSNEFYRTQQIKKERKQEALS